MIHIPHLLVFVIFLKWHYKPTSFLQVAAEQSRGTNTDLGMQTLRMQGITCLLLKVLPSIDSHELKQLCIADGVFGMASAITYWAGSKQRGFGNWWWWICVKLHYNSAVIYQVSPKCSYTFLDVKSQWIDLFSFAYLWNFHELLVVWVDGGTLTAASEACHWYCHLAHVYLVTDDIMNPIIRYWIIIMNDHVKNGWMGSQA